MIESIEEFNDLLNRLKAKQKENKLGKSLQIKLQAFLEVEELINLRIGGVSKSFKVVDIDLFDYKQITIVNEKEKYIVCHMYTMDNVDINRVRKQAKAMCDALNVC